MTRMESWLKEATAVATLGVVSEAIFFQELLGISNTLISPVDTPCVLPPTIAGGLEFGMIAVLAWGTGGSSIQSI